MSTHGRMQHKPEHQGNSLQEALRPEALTSFLAWMRLIFSHHLFSQACSLLYINVPVA